LLQADLKGDLETSLDGVLARGPSGNSAQPNVLLITVDALRADHLGACGNSWIKTPSIDTLARYSSLSCSTYTQQPQTNPALASLFTSTYPAVNGVRVHMVDRLSESFDTLAKILQRNGYNTGGIIPWTSLEPAFSGFQQGFHTYEAFVLNEPETLQNPTTAALAGLYRRVTQQVALGSAVESVLGLRQGTEASIDGRADVTATAAVNWLANNSKSHFFLWVHYFDPHYPWTPPEPWDQLYEGGRDYDGKYDGGMGFVYEMRAGVFEPNPRDVEYLRALYASEVSYTDHYIGQLLGYMARFGLLDNTIVVLTADHGEQLGERGEWWPNGEYWLHGDDLHDDGIQVPLIIYDPRTARGHQDLEIPIQHVDIMPTILDLVGLPASRQAQGRSLAPILAGKDTGADRIAVTTLGDDSQTSIVSADGWKLIASANGSLRELYYLPDDPGERNNLASTYPGRYLALLGQLNAWAQANNIKLAGAIEDVPRG
jgi:arylsulfatase A-like enzyme